LLGYIYNRDVFITHRVCGAVDCRPRVELATAVKAVASGAAMYVFEPCQAVSGALIFDPAVGVKRIPGGRVDSVVAEVSTMFMLVEGFCNAHGGCNTVEVVEVPAACVGDICAAALGDGRVHVFSQGKYYGGEVPPSACGEELKRAAEEVRIYAEREGAERRLYTVERLGRPWVKKAYLTT